MSIKALLAATKPRAFKLAPPPSDDAMKRRERARVALRAQLKGEGFVRPERRNGVSMSQHGVAMVVRDAEAPHRVELTGTLKKALGNTASPEVWVPVWVKDVLCVWYARVPKDVTRCLRVLVRDEQLRDAVLAMHALGQSQAARAMVRKRADAEEAQQGAQPPAQGRRARRTA